MTIWTDRLFYLLGVGVLIGGLLWVSLKRSHYQDHQLLVDCLTVGLILTGLLINGIGVYFLIQPFYDFGLSLTLSLFAIIIGGLYLLVAFIFLIRKK
ncbi:hypothetical protein ACFQ22_06725 [Lentilactobacillus raoultii]|uniref:Uncharacterized protein n=1 Tax=Lentilactobacillus raoultii TaxID=1987503 RepID=A0ABW3PDU9_9LACO|nr:hypothetical protein [Lentilactobacillus raoultii]